MEIWIRSQDKLTMKKLYGDVRLKELIVDKTEIYVDGECMGSFKDKDKAISVLTNISNYIQFNTSKFISDKSYTKPLTYESPYYYSSTLPTEIEYSSIVIDIPEESSMSDRVALINKLKED